MKPFLLLGPLLLLAACRSEPAHYLPEESAKYSLENTEKFRLLDRPAQQAIACTGLQERVNEAGRLELVANLRNRGTAVIEMQVRCVFLDATGWRQVMRPPGCP